MDIFDHILSGRSNMSIYGDSLKGKKVLVVGLGKSGRAAIEVLHNIGANVYLQDSKKPEDLSDTDKKFLGENKVSCYLGGVPEDMGSFDLLVVSPGVSPALNFIQAAVDAGVEIIGELELAFRLGKGKYLAITGTNGKTTTTTLVGEIVKNAKKDTRVVGNIGNPIVTESVKATDDTYLVAELSSFQLETIDQFRPSVGAILNLTPDHMDRHLTMENYGAAKARITANQTADDFIVVNFDDKESMKLIKGTQATVVPFSRTEPLKFGAFVLDDMITIVNQDEKKIPICKVDELQIPGSHNLENALAAAAIAYFGGIDPEVIGQTLRVFRGVEHRLEPAGEVEGVKFVNDSKGTNTDAAIKAIEAIDTPIILIAGGYDKNADFSDFIDAFEGKVKGAVLLGATAGKIKATAEKKGFNDTIILKDMASCVEEAFRIAVPGDTVLLSPACASWDMYTGFEERGRDFKDCVKNLK